MSQPPPPPPPGSPPPPPPEWAAPGGGVPFSVGDALAYGWRAYWRNVGPMALLALAILVVNVAIGLLGSTTDDLASRIAARILILLVGIILAMGLIRAALAVTEGRTPEMGMLLRTEGFGNYAVASILVAIGVVVGFVLLVVPGIILAIMWHFFGYAIVQDPSTSPTEALRRSAEITKGHRWQLFGLGITLLLLNLAGVLACGVGLIFTYGITAITVAYTYKRLSGQPVVAL
jgi:uncharacterized membrane protein